MPLVFPVLSVLCRIGGNYFLVQRTRKRDHVPRSDTLPQAPEGQSNIFVLRQKLRCQINSGCQIQVLHAAGAAVFIEEHAGTAHHGINFAVFSILCIIGGYFV